MGVLDPIHSVRGGSTELEVVRSRCGRTGRILRKWPQTGTKGHRSVQSRHSRLSAPVLLVILLVVVCLPAGSAAPAQSLVCANGFLLRPAPVSTQTPRAALDARGAYAESGPMRQGKKSLTCRAVRISGSCSPMP